MEKPLHIALGESVEACLRAACRAHGMPGTTLGIPDNLRHGPLDDGRARMNYMRGCFRGYWDWPFQATDSFLPWRAMIERIEKEEPESILVWSGDSVSEATFLAMACWWLQTRPEPLLRVGRTRTGRPASCGPAIRRRARRPALLRSKTDGIRAGRPIRGVRPDQA
jgi:hypothetical protein